MPDPLAPGEARQACPALSQLMLGRALRQLREQARISPGQASQAIRVPVPGIGDLEQGRHTLRLADVAALCELYGVTDHYQRVTLLSLADLARMPRWQDAYHDVIPGWFEPYLGLEPAADLIRGYETRFISGLLQTPGYARAVLSHGTCPRPAAERRAELRIRRQQVLHRPDPPRLWMLIGEAALHRATGSRALMAAQLRHLLHACATPGITIQVLPSGSCAHLVRVPFTMLRFPGSELPDLIYQEHPGGARYPGALPRYLHLMNLLATQASPADATPAILSQILGSL